MGSIEREEVIKIVFYLGLKRVFQFSFELFDVSSVVITYFGKRLLPLLVEVFGESYSTSVVVWGD